MIVMPAWVQDLMGERELRIANHPKARSLCEDRDGNRLPYYQRLIETPNGDSFTIDQRRRAIIN